MIYTQELHRNHYWTKKCIFAKNMHSKCFDAIFQVNCDLWIVDFKWDICYTNENGCLDMCFIILHIYTTIWWNGVFFNVACSERNLQCNIFVLYEIKTILKIILFASLNLKEKVILCNYHVQFDTKNFAGCKGMKINNGYIPIC